MIFLGFIFLFFSILHEDRGYAREITWPTDASRLLTSSFAEYRAGHFHAGMDLKTWGQTGYKVFAVRSGYIMRIWVSPFGYGRALYLKCDNGDIVIYGHLQGFIPEIEALVKAEQQRQGRFSVQLYPIEGQIPVEQGQLVAYTGDTGIGPPHLHFEIRDANNAPINAMLRGYQIEDTIAPVPTAVSLTPLDGNSQVDNETDPVVLSPQYLAPATFRINQPIDITGRVGFAVNCYDQANGADNKFSPVKIRLVIENQEIFVVSYERFSYDLTSQIHLDRDFRFIVQGKGGYHKLFRDVGNRLGFYNNDKVWSGVVTTDPADNLRKDKNGNAHYLAPGKHNWRIEISDFNNNLASIEGTLLVCRKPEIRLTISQNEPGKKIAFIENLTGHTLTKVDIWGGNAGTDTWQLLKNWINPAETTGVPVDSALKIPLQSGGDGSSLAVFRAIVEDLDGIKGFPAFYVEPVELQADKAELRMFLRKYFYDNFIRFELTASRILANNPDVNIRFPGNPGLAIPVRQTEKKQYVGIINLYEEMLSPMTIEVSAQDLFSQSVVMRDTVHFYPASTKRPGFLLSQDRQCRVVFTPASVYQPLFARVQETRVRPLKTYDTAGKVYRIEPDDVPLKDGALIYLNYPADDPMPEKLAICWWHRKQGTWKFLDNEIDQAERTISGKVGSFGIYTLVRDEVPPEIFSQYPDDNAVIATRRPKLLAHLRDDFSGIHYSMAMHLDGKKVIAEYDPDRMALFYTPDEPLTNGTHILTVWARDRCGNETTRTSRFVIQ